MLSLEALAMLSCVGDIAASQLIDDSRQRMRHDHRQMRLSQRREQQQLQQQQQRRNSIIVDDNIERAAKLRNEGEGYDADSDTDTTQHTTDDEYDDDDDDYDDEFGDRDDEGDDDEEEDIDPLENTENARRLSYIDMRDAVKCFYIEFKFFFDNFCVVSFSVHDVHHQRLQVIIEILTR